MKLFARLKRRVGINVNGSQKSSGRFIVSLTSFPPRFDALLIALESLLNQNNRPDKIVLWLSKEELENGIVPPFLSRVKKRGVEICLVEENFRSYKKLIYAVDKYPDDIIITCDDDQIYPPDFLCGLIKVYSENPRAVSAYRCYQMRKQSENELLEYKHWKLEPSKCCSLNLFPTGVGGVLYPPNSLYSDLVNHDVFMRLAPDADDVWFKAMTLMMDIPVQCVGKDLRNRITIKGSQHVALSKSNVGQERNDEQLKAVFDYYDLYKLIALD